MANIGDLTEAWAGHSGLEVESFLKQQLGALDATLRGKFGYVEFNTQTKALVFYDQEGGTVLGSITLSGDVYTVSIQSNLSQAFYVLADETTKVMTISASTTVAPFGSSQTVAYPEAYTYTVAVNTGTGYVTRITGNIAEGGSASFDLRPYLATGDNYIRVSVTGVSSGQTRTVVYTGTLTSLTLTVNHSWQTAWNENSDYVINGIRFAGSVIKTLHVAITNSAGVTTELTPVEYRANQSYTTTSTTYTIPYTAFPTMEHNGVNTVSLWMTAEGISTPVTSYQIMCVKANDTTPIVAINEITAMAVNFTSGNLFSYAVYGANKVSFTMAATLNSVIYPVTSQPIVTTGLEENLQYRFAYSLEVDTGVNDEPMGSLAVSAKAYYDNTEGSTATASTLFDNTYSYIATPGALFYLNAAVRNNESDNYQTIINEAGAHTNFPATYTATWNGISWTNDGWTTDDNGIRALVIPAGASVTFNNFAPLSYFANQAYSDGMAIEFMLKSGHPSNYTDPVFSMASGGLGIFIYPTKIVVYGSNESEDVKQSVMLSEGQMTHIVVSFVRNYENVATRNLCSIYINGISNVNFAFDGASGFGSGNFVMGQSDTDAYLYKMRVYGTPLDSQAVLNNFFNAITDGIEFNRRENYDDNQILDGVVVDYQMVKSAGFNTMVVTMTNDSTPIPDIDHQAPEDGFQNCSMKFEYAGHPQWNVTVGNVSIDGQGTTSKKYFRWNLRAKTGDSTTWLYGDGTTGSGKIGKFINAPGYANIDRITAKKNYASSMQGHKMGMTGLYNDIFKELGLGSHIPNSIYQVAVYQFPFVGFRYYENNNSYEYIGLYTAGPDKGSKETFGYLASYSKLLSLEGPNHDPRGTRFLHPWVDVNYDYQNETLTFGGEEGWDCDFVGGGLKTDKAASQAALLALYTDEWKPAYDIVYHCSPYIESLSAALSAGGYASVAAANADIDNFLAGSTNGVKNALLSFYDSNYDVWFYRTSDGGKLHNLTTVEGSGAHNIKTYLGLTGNPTKEQIISARAAKFVNDAPNYWDIDQTLYHYCFCVLLGVTDNFAKNTYPFKFRGYNETLGTGESTYCKRWGWRQDDLDTVLATDNNGRNTKMYYVEHGDLSNAGVELFQGGDSALWVLIRDNYETSIKEMMANMMSAMQAIASRNNIVGTALHNTVFNVISFYCWDKTAKYFCQTLYETDRRWAYIEPWLQNATKEYNNVLPLDQALGDEYQSEKLWVERRVAYIFSKYRIGAFSGTDTSYGGIAITLASPFTFNLTPAIELYPVGSVASTDYPMGTYSPDSMRTQPGTAVQIALPAGGASNNYIHGADWLSSLGDLSRMVLTDRSTGENISFSVQSERLQTLKVGDDTAGNVDFNATSLSVASPTITTLYAQNTSTVKNIVDLMRCPRLRVVKFAGSGATGLYLPVGAKLTEVSFPDNASTVFMHSLPFLQSSGLTLPTLSKITTLYMNNCTNLNPFDIVTSILGTTGETLQFVTIIWRGIVTGTIATIRSLSELDGKVVYDGSVSTTSGMPHVEGTANVPGMYADDLDFLQLTSPEPYQTDSIKALSNLFGTQFYVIYNPSSIWIDFADSTVENICITNWDTNHDNHLSTAEAAAVTALGKKFRGNTSITSFNEFKYFTGVTSLAAGGSANDSEFGGCTGLTSISLPPSVSSIGAYAFANCSYLTSISIPGTVTSGEGAFANCSRINRIDITDLTKWLNCTWNATNGAPLVANSSGAHLYLNGEEVTNLVIPTGITVIGHRVMYRIGITSVTFHNAVTQINDYSFFGCPITSLSFPDSLTRIQTQSFAWCPITSLNLNKVQYIGSQAFYQCTRLTEVTFPPSLNYAGVACFQNSGLTKLTFSHPNTTLQIEGSVFNATQIAAFYYPDIQTLLAIDWTNSSSGYPWYLSNTNQGLQYHKLYIGGEEVTEFAFPAGTTSIKTGVLAGCNYLTSITIPSTVTSIGNFAFVNIRNVINLDIPCSTSAYVVGMTGKAVGTLTIHGNYTVMDSVYAYHDFKRFIIYGNAIFNSANLSLTRDAYVQVIRIGGGYNTSNKTGVTTMNNGSTRLHFIEVLGDVPAYGNLVGSAGASSTAFGTRIHLGKNGVISGSRGSVTSANATSINNIIKIYVGPGESQAGDEAILQQYLAASDWSSYNYKLDTWWNYKQISRLPSAYTRLDYIWSNNSNQYIDTGVAGNNENLRFKFGVTLHTFTSYGTIFGNFVNDGSDCWRLIFATANTSMYVSANRVAAGGTMVYTHSSSMLTRYWEFDISSAGFTLFNTTKTNYENRGVVNNTNILIGRNGTSTVSVQKRFYFFQVYDNGTLIRDYAPCKRVSDGVCGFYDTVNNTFNPSTGAENFPAGYDFEYADDAFND